MGAAAATAGTAEPSGYYSLDLAAGRHARVTLLQEGDTTTQPLWSGMTLQSDARDSEPSYTAAAMARAG